jgi:N-acetyltransferase 10
MDDELNILPISDHINNIEPVDVTNLISRKVADELEGLKKSLAAKEVVGHLLAKAKTLDQAKVIMTLLDVLNDKSAKATISLTAGRGRGKSAAIGLAIAAAIQLGFSNIFVTAPSPENLKTLFEFICLGLEALDYKDRLDYEKIYSASKDHDKPVIRI